MSADPKKVGEQILSLRKTKGLTQQELGERLNISFQAISKWERGETLPDTALLPDLADVLETTVDNLLASGDRTTKFQPRSGRPLNALSVWESFWARTIISTLGPSKGWTKK